jgi:GlpG protein
MFISYYIYDINDKIVIGDKMNNINKYFSYNSKVVLSFFFICLVLLIIDYITAHKLSRFLSLKRGSIINPMTYIRMITNSFVSKDWNHFHSNFIYILLLGPMLEEKYGSIPLLEMILITSLITGLFNNIFFKKVSLKGASGTVYMFILLSSFVNISQGKIPITLILIFLFYIVSEIRDGLFKKDNISHMGHLIGAICGCIFGYFVF